PSARSRELTAPRVSATERPQAGQNALTSGIGASQLGQIMSSTQRSYWAIAMQPNCGRKLLFADQQPTIGIRHERWQFPAYSINAPPTQNLENREHLHCRFDLHCGGFDA